MMDDTMLQMIALCNPKSKFFASDRQCEAVLTGTDAKALRGVEGMTDSLVKVSCHFYRRNCDKAAS
jgi:hypothetical protein